MYCWYGCSVGGVKIVIQAQSVLCLHLTSTWLCRYAGIIDLTRKLNSKYRDPLQTQEATKTILRSLFPSWLPRSFKVSFSTHHSHFVIDTIVACVVMKIARTSLQSFITVHACMTLIKQGAGNNISQLLLRTTRVPLFVAGCFTEKTPPFASVALQNCPVYKSPLLYCCTDPPICQLMPDSTQVKPVALELQ